MADVLVLDANYRPVGFCSWDRAVKNVWEDRADVIKEDEAGRKLHGGRNAAGYVFEMGMPRVIRVRNAWVKRKKQSVPFSRRNIYVRDGGECQYCLKALKTNDYTLDHVVPRCLGGISSWTNLVLACLRCNKRKAGQTPAQAGMKLMKAPVEPKVDDPKYNFKLHINTMRPEWKEWETWLYWNVELEK
jgi:5-methylcytosine-specific restriction endonuclease McrA